MYLRREKSKFDEIGKHTDHTYFTMLYWSEISLTSISNYHFCTALYMLIEILFNCVHLPSVESDGINKIVMPKSKDTFVHRRCTFSMGVYYNT